MKTPYKILEDPIPLFGYFLDLIKNRNEQAKLPEYTAEIIKGRFGGKHISFAGGLVKVVLSRDILTIKGNIINVRTVERKLKAGMEQDDIKFEVLDEKANIWDDITRISYE